MTLPRETEYALNAAREYLQSKHDEEARRVLRHYPVQVECARLLSAERERDEALALVEDLRDVLAQNLKVIDRAPDRECGAAVLQRLRETVERRPAAIDDLRARIEEDVWKRMRPVERTGGMLCSACLRALMDPIRGK